MFRKIFPTIIFLIVLNACTNSSPVITPTIAIVPISAYTATPLSTASSSATLEPSPTPYFINTSRTATVQAFNQLIDVFPGMCDSYRNSLLKSADGNWLAQDCSGDSLRIIYKNGSTKREVTYKEIFEKGENYPYNQGAIYPKHWTNDSQYLYFSVLYCCWDPGIMLLSEGSSLYRLNINDGSYNLIRSGLFNASFSPTDRRVTFIDELIAPPIVEIQDLISGSVNKIKLNVATKYNQASVNTWSTDGLRFAVSAASGSLFDYNSQESSKFSLLIVDVKDLTQRVIVKDMPTVSLHVLNWSEDDVLTFQTGHPSFSEPIKIWKYDLKSDTLISSTPNP